MDLQRRRRQISAYQARTSIRAVGEEKSIKSWRAGLEHLDALDASIHCPGAAERRDPIAVMLA